MPRRLSIFAKFELDNSPIIAFNPIVCLSTLRSHEARGGKAGAEAVQNARLHRAAVERRGGAGSGRRVSHTCRIRARAPRDGTRNPAVTARGGADRKALPRTPRKRPRRLPGAPCLARAGRKKGEGVPAPFKQRGRRSFADGSAQ